MSSEKHSLDKSAVMKAYNEEDWGSLPNFAGNFVNFGYWKNIISPDDTQELTLVDRVKSCSDFYKKVGESLALCSDDAVLEVGCGRGSGIDYIARTYHPKLLVGIDLSQHHIQIAHRITSANFLKKFHIEFQCKDIEVDTLPANTFDKVYSLEVFQHIGHHNAALRHIFESLKPRGKVLITTYFLPQLCSLAQLQDYFPLAITHQEHPICIQDMIKLFEQTGFENIQVTAIGDVVFHGYEKWITQEQVDTPCSHVYAALYKKGLLDYYMIQASKPVSIDTPHKD